jgi:hypothetical protein
LSTGFSGSSARSSVGCRHFCRLMGGDLTVESVYGQGSTFTVRLPAHVEMPIAAPSD